MFSVSEVADLLGIHRTTVYELVKAGQIKSTRVGQLIRVTAAEVRRLLDSTPDR